MNSRNVTQIVNQLYFNKISYTSITIINYTSMVFPVVMYGCESWTIRKLSNKELMLLNYGVGEDSSESLGLLGDPTSPS